MRTQIWTRFAVLVLVLVAALFASPTGRVAGQIMGDLPTNWVFTPAGVTNLQAVRLTYANTLPVPVIVSMAILRGKVNGATWTPKVLASQQNVVVQPGQGTVLVLDWNAAGGLATGERAQVFGQVQVNGLIEARKGSVVASLEISDLLGAAIPEIVEPKNDPSVDPKDDPITQDFHFNPVIVTNRHVVRLSFINTDPTPVRITTAILGGKMTGATWNAGTLLAGQKDLLVEPGQGTVLTLDWNATSGQANSTGCGRWAPTSTARYGGPRPFRRRRASTARTGRRPQLQTSPTPISTAPRAIICSTAGSDTNPTASTRRGTLRACSTISQPGDGRSSAGTRPRGLGVWSMSRVRSRWARAAACISATGHSWQRIRRAGAHRGERDRRRSGDQLQ